MSFQKFRERCVKLAGANAHLLEQPPRGIAADLALPCFVLAKEKRKDPALIAKELAGQMKPSSLIKGIKAEGPYVNFYADWDKLGKGIIRQAIKENENFGKVKRRKSGRGRRGSLRLREVASGEIRSHNLQNRPEARRVPS